MFESSAAGRCLIFVWVLQFVAVVGPDGKKKRFAVGTRAGFAVERFNKLIPNDSKPVVCIQAYKEGEEPIEYGPDVELYLYDNSWTLQCVSECKISLLLSDSLSLSLFSGLAD